MPTAKPMRDRFVKETEDAVAFVAEIHALQDKMGWTDTETAARLDIHRAQLHQWGDRTLPSARTMERVRPLLRKYR